MCVCLFVCLFVEGKRGRLFYIKYYPISGGSKATQGHVPPPHIHFAIYI